MSTWGAKMEEHAIVIHFRNTTGSAFVKVENPLIGVDRNHAVSIFNKNVVHKRSEGLYFKLSIFPSRYPYKMYR